MKGFFENLFGKKPLPRDVQKRAEPAAWRPSQQPDFEPYKKGDVIGGKYYVHGILGMGGFGVVLLASERGTNQVRVLKTFRDEFLADAGTREAFKKEALLWVNLEEHPFIVAARWVEEFSGRLFVAMDYVAPDAEGRVNLGDHLQCGKPISPECAVKWAIQFCIGMEHAIAHGIRCHRDIKPANILIAQDGTLKIADFGLAAAQHTLTEREQLFATLCLEEGMQPIIRRSADRERLFVTRAQDGSFGFSMIQTEGKTTCGTPGYMAPEVYRGETADVRSDIYSFGLVLWQMAMGSTSPPFIGDFHGDVEAFMRTTYERQISEQLPYVSDPLRAVIERCLKPAPAKRYASFGEVRDALEPIFKKATGRCVTIPIASENTVAFWCNKGGSLAALGRNEEAIACFDKALGINPRDAMTWCNKGAALVKLERCEAAIVCFDKTLTIDPQDAMAWRNKGGALVELGRRGDALVCYDKSLAIDPRSPLSWNNKGKIFKAFGLHEKALVCFENTLTIDPKHSAAWNNKARSLANLGRHQEAIACYDKAIAIEPGDALLWNNKGACFAAMRRREDEIACYEKALEIDPQHAMAWFNKAGTEDEVGRTAAAIRSYSKFLEFAPTQYSEQIASVQRRLRSLQDR